VPSLGLAAEWMCDTKIADDLFRTGIESQLSEPQMAAILPRQAQQDAAPGRLRLRRLRIPSAPGPRAPCLSSVQFLECSTLLGAIAQLGERYNGIVEVGGSIPPGSTTIAEPAQCRL
jgi:hypothetical protein